MLQPITNQQPDDYKDPISQSGDKVRSCNNKVNKHMSSKLEDKGINGKKSIHITKYQASHRPKAKLLFSKQWTQAKAKEKELHIVQSNDYTG